MCCLFSKVMTLHKMQRQRKKCLGDEKVTSGRPLVGVKWPGLFLLFNSCCPSSSATRINWCVLSRLAPVARRPGHSTPQSCNLLPWSNFPLFSSDAQVQRLFNPPPTSSSPGSSWSAAPCFCFCCVNLSAPPPPVPTWTLKKEGRKCLQMNTAPRCQICASCDRARASQPAVVPYGRSRKNHSIVPSAVLSSLKFEKCHDRSSRFLQILMGDCATNRGASNKAGTDRSGRAGAGQPWVPCRCGTVAFWVNGGGSLADISCRCHWGNIKNRCTAWHAFKLSGCNWPLRSARRPARILGADWRHGDSWKRSLKPNA